MYDVIDEYADYSSPTNKRSFGLNSNQPFNPYTWNPPIKWEGFVGEQTVKFIQTDKFAYSTACFDWTDFPKELENAKYYIAKAIDKALKVMD